VRREGGISVDRFSGPKLRAVRERVGLSREQLAVAVPCSASAIVKWENGYGPPKRPTLLRLLRVLDCPIEDLVEPDPDFAEAAQ